MCDQMEKGSENSNVIGLHPKTAEQEVNYRIQKKKVWLKNTRGARKKVSPRAALLNFAQVLTEIAVYLTELNKPELGKAIDCLIEIAAKIQTWLS